MSETRMEGMNLNENESMKAAAAMGEMRMNENSNGFARRVARYGLNLIWLLDGSISMRGEKINQLNGAVAESAAVAEEAANENEIDLSMRVIQFSTDAHWQIGSTENGADHMEWKDIEADGLTNTAAALDLASTVMHRDILGTRNYPPVVILITDGQSNDTQKTLEAIDRLKNSLQSVSEPGKDKILRIAIGVSNADQKELEAFASVGTIEHADGSIEEHAPFVFRADQADVLKGLLKSLTVSSINSALGAGTRVSEDEEITLTMVDTEADWED